MITLTEAAVRQVSKQLSKRGHGLGLRLGVKKSGCSGYAYVIDYADALEDGDAVYEQGGGEAKVVVNAAHLDKLQGLTLDYVRDGLNESYKFINPNVTAECGCGESFAV